MSFIGSTSDYPTVPSAPGDLAPVVRAGVLKTVDLGSELAAMAATDAELAAIAGLTSAADKGIQFTGAGTAATYDLTAAGKALLDDADATAQRATLGLGTVAALASDSDGTLAADSDARVATQKATKTAIAQAIADLLGTAPGVLNTLGEISDAINDDANLYTTLVAALALKAPLASPALTGNPTAPTASPGDNDTSIATTAFVTAAVSAGGSASPWINVRDAAYGAIGNGSTDDTTAIAAAVTAINALTYGGVLYFPPGIYMTSGGHVFTKQVRILGDGCADALAAVAISTVSCTSSTAKLFDFQQHGSAVQSIHLKNTAGSTPTAGCAIYTTAGDGTRIVDVSVDRFYDNIDIQDGCEWYAARVFSYGFARYGWRIRHVDLPDGGDWTMTDCHFIAKTLAATSGIRIESGGGGKIINTKVNIRSGSLVNGIDLTVGAGISTILFLLSNSSVENCTGVPIKISCPSGSNWQQIKIDGCQTGQYGTVNQYAVEINATTAGSLNEVSISNCIFVGNGSSTLSAISLTNIDNVSIGGCVANLHPTLLVKSGCTNIRNDNARYGTKTLTDASTVTPDATNFENFAWTIGGNRTLGAPAALYSGQTIQIRVTQDGTGARTVTPGTGVKTLGGAGLTLSAAAGAKTIISMQYDGNDGTWFANAGAYS